MYHGDFALEQTFDVKFTTRRFSTGAPHALAGSPVVSAYPDNSTTELTAGITLTADFDARTGLNNVRVVATAANGYAAGVNYALVITTGTVDSVSVVGEVIGTFSIAARSALRPATAGRTLVVEADGMAHADVKEVGGTTQTARDLGASVLLSPGTGTGQISLTSGAVTAGTVSDKTGYGLADGAITSAKVADGFLTAAKFAAGAFDAVWSVATRTLTAILGLIPLAITTGAVVDDASNSATTFETDLSETDDHFWKDSFLLITSGALVGQQKRIIAYDGTTKFVTVLGGFTAEPAAGSTFAIVNR